MEIVRKIGGGFYGEVWEALWHGKTRVAVKWLRDADTRELLSEIDMMRKVKHPNIVVFFGAAKDPETSSLRIVTELMDESLLSFLRERESLDPSVALKICVDVCSGMHHLATLNYIHRDLAARNVLIRKISDSVESKICDFGLGRYVVLI